jgi:hypothetical protein
MDRRSEWSGAERSGTEQNGLFQTDDTCSMLLVLFFLVSTLKSALQRDSVYCHALAYDSFGPCTEYRSPPQLVVEVRHV